MTTRRLNLIEGIAPWFIWIAFFLLLALMARRTNVGAATSNPRSLTQTSTTTTIATTGDCRGDTLQDRGEVRARK